MSRLYIFGDSFAAPYDNPQTWTEQLAQQLGLDIVNHARSGTSQDYAWAVLQHYIPEFTPEDRVVIVLTHPSRRWYFQNKPQLSNINIIDLDQHLTRDESRAVELYIKHIQRPQTDTLDVSLRLGWLSWQIHQRGLAQPVIIKAFEQDIIDPLSVESMLVAEGSLYDVDLAEFAPGITADQVNGFWLGHDARYNHLCLTNHQIMADKLAESIRTGVAADLTRGFRRQLLADSVWNDPNFVSREFNPKNAELCLRARHERRSFVPWRAKAGITGAVGG